MSPTGYTSDLYDGEQTFAAFALTCARNFGALLPMKDDPMDAPIPDEFEASPWHVEGLKRAQAALAEVEAMNILDCATGARVEYEAWDKDRKEHAAEAATRIERYKAMLVHVIGWTPPSDEHTGLREFMVEQLELSIEYDGPILRRDEGPPREARAWRAAEIDRALRDIAYHAEELRKEQESARRRTAWLKALRGSLR